MVMGIECVGIYKSKKRGYRQMTPHNISITRDVYDMLVRLRHGDESFSEVIMRLADDQKRDPLRFFGILSDEATEFVDIVEDSMEKTKQSAVSVASKKAKEMKVKG